MYLLQPTKRYLRDTNLNIAYIIIKITYLTPGGSLIIDAVILPVNVVTTNKVNIANPNKAIF